jgi:protein-export membrane protein SecD
MEIKKLLKNWQVLIWLLLFLFFLALLVPISAKGVVVKHVAEDSPFFGKLKVGDTITWVNEKPVESIEDFYQFENFSGVMRMMVNGKLVLADVNNYLGIVVKEPEKTRIKLGMDLVGGTRVLLKVVGNVSEEVIDQAIATLETRINVYGLKEARFQKVLAEDEKYIQIEMAGGSLEEIKELLEKQGNFEAKIPKIVSLENGKGELLLGGKKFEVEKTDGSVIINGRELKINETFTLEGIEFEVFNISETQAIFLGKVFESKDIKSVCTFDQPGVCRSFVQFVGNGYEFVFQVMISREAAEKFATITKDMKIVFDAARGEYVLENGIIYLYLDDKLITQLQIDKGLRGKAETQPSITGFRETKEDAEREKLMLQSILSSGRLPVKLEMERVDEISPSLGIGFLKEIIIIAIIAEIVIVTTIFLRYRNPKIVLPMVLVSLSEVVMILGVATLIGWTIDLAAIAAIIAILGTGIDAQIMIIDEVIGGVRKVYTIKEKIKRAFFIIFSSATTTFVAMLPLMIIGAKLMQGFAITTIIGIAISVFVTRPAFGRIVEEIMGRV